MKNFLEEFKQFIARGNVMDMAVGVIVGGAFKSIVDSLTNDILMPFISTFLKAEKFSNLTLTIGETVIAYGNFIQSIINFLIMAFVVFVLVKILNQFHRKKEEVAPETPAPDPIEVLLTEIRDELKKR